MMKGQGGLAAAVALGEFVKAQGDDLHHERIGQGVFGGEHHAGFRGLERVAVNEWDHRAGLDKN